MLSRVEAIKRFQRENGLCFASAVYTKQDLTHLDHANAEEHFILRLHITAFRVLNY